MADQKKDDQHTLAVKRYETAFDADAENRAEAEEDLRFLLGDQWDEEVKKNRTNDNRPVLTINRLPQFQRQIANDIRMSKPAMKIGPGDDETDRDKAEVIEGLVRSIERAPDAQAAYYMAADSQVACGIGHWRVTTDYIDDDSLDQEILIEPIEDGLGVIWDNGAVKPTREDGMFCFVPVDIERETFKDKHPDAQEVDFKSAGDYGWSTEDSIRVMEYWFKKPYHRTFYVLTDGQAIPEEKLQDGELERYERDKVIDRTVTREAYKVFRALMTQSEFIEDPVEVPYKNIPIVPVVGEEVRIGKAIHRRGAIRFARDPQRIYNYWTTANTEFVALQPIAPWVGTIANFAANADEWEQANKKPYAYLPYEPDPGNGGAPPQRPMPPQASQGMLQGLSQASEDMKATTGIYDAGLGAKSNETSGRAIMARQQEGDISTYVYMDNFTRAIRRTGEIIVDMIPHYYDNARKVAILGPDGNKGIVPINQAIQTQEGGEAVTLDLTTGKYDIVIEGGPSFTTRRAEAASAMEALITANPNLFEVIGDIYVKSQDWPMANDISDRIQKMQRQNHPYLFEDDENPAPPDPMKQMQAQMQMRGAEAEISETEAKTAKAKAEALQTEVETAQAVMTYPSGLEIPQYGRQF